MSDRPAKLATLQSWMQAVVTEPGGAQAGVAGEQARRHLEVTPEGVEAVVTPSHSLSGLERLAIYNRAYRARLLECFRVEFPCLRHALGDELFTLFVGEYLEAHPPRGYTLGRLGAELATFLEWTRPDAAAPAEAREGWASFLVDLATLERTYLEVYDGEGSEGEALLSPEDLLGMPPPALRALRLRPVRGLRVLGLRSAVDEYFFAVRRGETEEVPLPPAGEVALAVFRREYVVRLLRLSEAEAALLVGLSEGKAVQEPLAAGEPGWSEGEARRAILHWAEEGIFLRSAPG